VLPLLAILWKVLCIENGIIEHTRGRRPKETNENVEKNERADTLVAGERKLRASSALMDRSDSWERVEKRARASSALSSVGGVSGLGLTGLGGITFHLSFSAILKSNNLKAG
jgi:hypothetical protein